jgi:hypothetical protein
VVLVAGWLGAPRSLADAAQLREQAGAADRSVLEVAAEVIAAVRKAESEAQLSMRTEVASEPRSAPCRPFGSGWRWWRVICARPAESPRWSPPSVKAPAWQ